MVSQHTPHFQVKMGTPSFCFRYFASFVYLSVRQSVVSLRVDILCTGSSGHQAKRQVEITAFQKSKG